MTALAAIQELAAMGVSVVNSNGMLRLVGVTEGTRRQVLEITNAIGSRRLLDHLAAKGSGGSKPIRLDVNPVDVKPYSADLMRRRAALARKDPNPLGRSQKRAADKNPYIDDAAGAAQSVNANPYIA